MTRGWSSTSRSTRLVTDRPGNSLGGLVHLGGPRLVEPVGGCGHGKSGYEPALVVVDAGADAGDALLGLLVVEGIALVANLFELLCQGVGVSQRMVGVAR